MTGPEELPPPPPRQGPVVARGEFRFGVIGLEHPHVYGMTAGLIEAGAEVALVWDGDPRKVDAFCQRHPGCRPARSESEVIESPDIRLVASAAIPCERAPLGCRVMKAGKDFFSDKPAFTSLEQVEDARRVSRWANRHFFIYFSERLHVECAVYALHLMRQGAIGRVIHVVGLGPHRLAAAGRPDWFFDRRRSGGVLSDIGCHQVEQFLAFTGSQDAKLTYARTANLGHPEHPGFEDLGEAGLLGDSGASGYFRVDWFTPDGLRSWGDVRTMILGTEGMIELRKNLDLGRSGGGDRLLLANHRGERELDLAGKVGFPFFGQLILDCLYGTENAMPQAHIFRAAEIALKAQELANSGRMP